MLSSSSWLQHWTCWEYSPWSPRTPCQQSLLRAGKPKEAGPQTILEAWTIPASKGLMIPVLRALCDQIFQLRMLFSVEFGLTGETYPRRAESPWCLLEWPQLMGRLLCGQPLGAVVGWLREGRDPWTLRPLTLLQPLPLPHWGLANLWES